MESLLLEALAAHLPPPITVFVLPPWGQWQMKWALGLLPTYVPFHLH